MISNRLAFAVLGLATVTAAGGGAYLATRVNGPSAPATQASEVTPDSFQPVQETEAVIDPVGQRDEREQAPLASVEAPSQPTEIPVRPAAAVRRSPAASKPPVRTTQPAVAEVDRPSSAPPRAATVAPPAPEVAPRPTVTEPLQPVQAEEVRPLEATLTPAEPPLPTIRELVVSADSVLGLQLESTVSSERARVEDRVEARVVRDVRVGSEVAIPAGSRAIGSVMSVEQGGRLKDRARLGIRFHTLVLADGSQIPITSETIYRSGDAPGSASAAKIGGGAVAGAILGAILGGGKGAAIGGAAGAGAGTATVMAGERSAAVFSSGAEVTARIVSPVTVTVER